MANATVDQLINQYILKYGTTNLIKIVEQDNKSDKNRTDRPDRLVENIQYCVTNYDLSGLLELWNALETSLFVGLDSAQDQAITGLQHGVYRWYLVHASQNRRLDKVAEFFDKLTVQLCESEEWRDWFIFPHLKSPQENAKFSMYFTRQWLEVLMLSLHNLISIVLAASPRPLLSQMETLERRLGVLETENRNLRAMLHESHTTSGGVNHSLEMTDTLKIASSNVDVSKKRSKTVTSAPTNGNLGTTLGLSRLGRLEAAGVFGVSDLLEDEDEVNELCPLVKMNPVESMIDVTDFTGDLIYPPRNNSDSRNGAAPNAPAGASGNFVIDAIRKMSVTTSPFTKRSNKVSQSAAPRSSSVSSSSRSKSFSANVAPSGSNRLAAPCDSDFPPTPPPQSGATTTPEHAKLTRLRNVASSENIGSIHSSVVKIVSEHSGCSIGVADPGNDPELVLFAQEAYQEHLSAVTHVKFSDSGSRALSLDTDGVVKFWSPTPKPDRTITSAISKSQVFSVAWLAKSETKALLGNRQSKIRLFDIDQSRATSEALDSALHPRVQLLLSLPSGQRFVSSARGHDKNPACRLALWDVKTFVCEGEFPHEGGAVVCATTNHNGSILLTGNSDGQICVYDTVGRTLISKWPASQSEILAVAMDVDDHQVYTLGADGQLHIWSLTRAGKLLGSVSSQSLPAATGPFIFQTTRLNIPRGQILCSGAGPRILACAGPASRVYRIGSLGTGEGNIIEVTPSLVLPPATSRSSSIVPSRSATAPVISLDWDWSGSLVHCLAGGMDGRVTVSTMMLSKN